MAGAWGREQGEREDGDGHERRLWNREETMVCVIS